MKKIGFIICFLVLAAAAFGQQFVWSTISDTTMLKIPCKYVPLDNVTEEVLDFYDQYEFYYDLSGFNKEGFTEKMTSGSNNWGFLNEIENLTVFAIKANFGEGSVIFVMCIGKENVDCVIFSNNYEPNCRMTHRSNREKFARWFRTLLN